MSRASTVSNRAPIVHHVRRGRAQRSRLAGIKRRAHRYAMDSVRRGSRHSCAGCLGGPGAQHYSARGATAALGGPYPCRMPASAPEYRGRVANPCRYNGRHVNTRFAFTWWRRATVAAEAPRSYVASTIRRFCSMECLCRGPVRRPNASLATASAQVSVGAQRGQLMLRVHFIRQSFTAFA